MAVIVICRDRTYEHGYRLGGTWLLLLMGRYSRPMSVPTGTYRGVAYRKKWILTDGRWK